MVLTPEICQDCEPLCTKRLATATVKSVMTAGSGLLAGQTWGTEGSLSGLPEGPWIPSCSL